MSKEIEKQEVATISNLNDIQAVKRSETHIFTSIEDKKVIFNLNANVDNKINDFKGKEIEVHDVLIKTFKTKMEEPIIDEDTGEILQEFEYKKVCILIDEKGTSYVTGSKMFTNQMIEYLTYFGFDEMKETGVKIKITEREIKNSSNKALSFEIV